MQGFTVPPPPGLRERKKAETRAGLERAAVELALERDIAEVTIDDICAKIPVSHRTFFNYFDSKEDALFGFRSTWGDRDLVADRLAESYRGNIAEAVIDTLLRGLPDTGEPSLQEARMLIASRNPGLLALRLRRIHQLRTGLITAVADLIERERPPADGVTAEQCAELVIAAAIAAIGIAVREWAEEGACGAQEAVVARAVAVVRAVGVLVD